MAAEDRIDEDVTRAADRPLAGVVATARARLARIEGRASLRRGAPSAVAAAAIAASLRPLLWPIGDGSPPWIGAARALAVFAVVFTAASIALVIAGRRRRPSEILAARAVDGALGLADVISSGYAFEQANRVEPVVVLARRRAAKAALGLDVEASFPLPSLRPRPRAIGCAALAIAAALCMGGLDRALVEKVIAQRAEAAIEADRATGPLAAQRCRAAEDSVEGSLR